MTNQPPQPPNYGQQSPQPEPPKKKHTFRNIVLGVVAFFVVMGIVGSFLPEEESANGGSSQNASADQVTDTANESADDAETDDTAKAERRDARQEKREKAREERREKREKAAAEEKAAEEAAAEEKAEANAPSVEQENALASAQSYLDMSGFSAEGLVKQLKFEGYPVADAQWAVDNSGADWNAEAAESAQSYLDMSAFSRQGLIDQLTFEGYTPGEAAYGVSQAGL